MQKIIECVPNFSEGRRPELYRAIADAISQVPAAHVLDVSADSDHNRSVVTFVGTPEAIEEAAFQAIATAARLIDLDKHTGEHPRIGATDVCPFIPVKNATVEECIQIANKVGQRVGEELGIAVYLYGDAAKRPERKRLSDIRRGQYELWKKEIGT
ncbi:MAG: glutamate formiminotransferase, partial [Chloroflexota bacterium]